MQFIKSWENRFWPLAGGSIFLKTNLSLISGKVLLTQYFWRYLAKISKETRIVHHYLYFLILIFTEEK